MIDALAGLITVILAAIHIFAGGLRFLDVIPRSRWLSAAGGVAVAYIFVHVLPDLAESQERVGEDGLIGISWLDHHVYLISLTGLAVFYGLERVVRGSRRERAETTSEDLPPTGIFWVHIGSFGVYNALIGYLLLHGEVSGARSLALFGVAMALHFLTNDYGLQQDHRELYQHTARWILAAAVLVGFLIGLVVTVGEMVVDLIFAFIAGGVILNVMKEELPEERRSRFWPFALGATGYVIILLLV